VTKLEEVSRAICCPRQKCALGLDGKRCPGAEGCKFQARTVMEALRKPSEVMLDAGWDAGAGRFETPPTVEAAWSAMVDAALEEKP